MPLTMPEEVLLLMLDDRTGRLIDRSAPAGDYAIAAGLLMELALANRVDTDTKQLYVADPTPTGDQLADQVLARIAAEPTRRDSRFWIETLARDSERFREHLLNRLVERGVLRAEEGRFLWVFPERRYPAVSGREEREVKARLMGVLFNDDIPEPRDTLLIGLCRATGLFALILSSEELDRAEARINQVAELEELNRSLTEAVRDIYATMAYFGPTM
jgi:hypothetical protein